MKDIAGALSRTFAGIVLVATTVVGISATVMFLWSVTPWLVVGPVASAMVWICYPSLAEATKRVQARWAFRRRLRTGTCMPRDVYLFVARKCPNVDPRVCDELSAATRGITRDGQGALCSPTQMIKIIRSGAAPADVALAVRAGLSETELVDVFSGASEMAWETVEFLAALHHRPNVA